MARPSPALLASLALSCALPLLGARPADERKLVPAKPVDPEVLASIPHDGTRLFLHAGAFDPTRELPDLAALGFSEAPSSEYAIVQLKPGLVTERATLEARGLRFLGYLPDNAFLFRRTPGALAALAGSRAVRWVGDWRPGYRVHPRLWPGSGDQAAEVTLLLFREASPETVAREVAAASSDAVKTYERPGNGRGAELRYGIAPARRDAFVRAASQVEGVSFVEAYDPPELHNNSVLGPIQSNAATVLSGTDCTNCGIFLKGLTGTGQVATVADSGNDSDMCFFRKSSAAGDITDADSTTPPALGNLYPARKLLGYWVQPGATAYDNNAICTSSPTTWHGTHTSSTVVGDNFLNLSTSSAPGINAGDGMAPNAQLLFQDVGHDTTGCLSGIGDRQLMYQQALLGGARVHSNSYGSATGGAYSSGDSETDHFLFDHEEMTLFFSAGNSGSGSNTIGSPGNSKNVVTVGALGSGNSTTVASYSSRGPTDDGRLKPDIMAAGTVTSAAGDSNHASNNCSTKSLSGTSMACPATAGGAVLLRQYFADGYYPTGAANAADKLEANAPLVKAVLLNGTRALGSPAFGNNNYGWGRVWLDANLYFAGDARKLRVWNLPNVAGLATGQTRTFTVTVGAGQEVRATLVWSDAEAAAGAATTLVNNLDLTVTDGTNVWKGNVLNTTTGDSQTGGTADAVNNVEQFRLAAPTAGTYTITVAGTSVPGTGRAGTDRQGFALAVSSASCATGVSTAPTSPLALSNPTKGVDLSWVAAAGSAVTQVYRATGTCAASPVGAFQWVGSAAGSTHTDDTAEGGVTYAYRLRGADGCGEGPGSSCVEATPTGRCDTLPSFDGLASATGSASQCRVTLAWATAASNCPAAPTVTYNVYRSTTPGFAPSLGNLIASVAGVTSWNDDTVANGTTYHYVVRAENASGGGNGPHAGHEEQNTQRLWATAFGAPGVGTGTWTDDGGDTNAFLSAQPPWQLTTTQFQAGTRSYHSGPDTGTYPPGTCASVTTPSLALSTGSVLTFQARYNIEYQWDGVVIEASTDGGGTWAVLAPVGGYPTTLSQTGTPPINACAYPSTQGAFSGPSGNAALTAWTAYTVNLSPAYDNQTVRIRWRFSTDEGAEYQGFYLDTLAVTNVFLPGACTPPPPNTAPGLSAGPSVARTQASAATSASVGTVSDNETAAGGLAVAAISIPPGLTVTAVANSAGAVTATVGATCSAPVGSHPVVFLVQDPGGLSAVASLTVDVAANTAPVLGSYPASSVAAGGAVIVTPSAPPADNGGVVSLTASAPGFTGTFSGDPLTGVVSVSNAGPAGVHTVTVTALDTCGQTSTTTFVLAVGTLLHTVTPCRIADTRDAAGPLGGPALVAGGVRSFPIAGNCGVPLTATSVVLNVTVTAPTDLGDLRLFPTGQPAPLASTINYRAGQTRANNALVLLGTAGEMSIQCDQATGGVHVIVDTVGYFE